MMKVLIAVVAILALSTAHLQLGKEEKGELNKLIAKTFPETDCGHYQLYNYTENSVPEELSIDVRADHTPCREGYLECAAIVRKQNNKWTIHQQAYCYMNIESKDLVPATYYYLFYDKSSDEWEHIKEYLEMSYNMIDAVTIKRIAGKAVLFRDLSKHVFEYEILYILNQNGGTVKCTEAITKRKQGFVTLERKCTQP